MAAPWRAYSPAYRNCSVVGSGASLRGSQLGGLIDSHQLVIRVNRIAENIAAASEDLGSRTDAFFTTLCNVKQNATLWVPLQGHAAVDEVHRTCHLRTGDGCPFRRVVLRGPPKCSQHFARLTRTHLAVPVHVEDEALARDVDELVKLAAGSGLYDTSTGFHAVLTMALQCRKLTAFGFDGVGTYDGHAITTEHALTLEHSLLRLLQRGSVGGLPRGWERTSMRIFGASASRPHGQQAPVLSRRDSRGPQQPRPRHEREWRAP